MIYRKIKKLDAPELKNDLERLIRTGATDIREYSERVLSAYFTNEEIEFYNLIEDFIAFIGLYAPYYFAIPLMKFDKEHRVASSYLSKNGDNLESAIFTAYTLNKEDCGPEIIGTLFKNTKPLINAFVSTVAQMDRQEMFAFKFDDDVKVAWYTTDANLGQVFIINILALSYGIFSKEVEEFIDLQDIELTKNGRPGYGDECLKRFEDKDLPFYPEVNSGNKMLLAFDDRSYDGAIIIPPMDKIMDFDTNEIIEFNKEIKHTVKTVKVSRFVDIDITETVQGAYREKEDGPEGLWF